MRQLLFAVIAAALLAFAAVAVQPAAAQQQCPKGQTWDYASQSCKKTP
jgi:hypothetical protein